MKKVLTLFVGLCAAFGAQATVLFPHFVDIAPNYEEGLPEEMRAAGVPCGMYHSTKPGFLTSTFEEVEMLYKDTMPEDVIREQKQMEDGRRLVIYSSVSKSSDTMATAPLHSTIYVLEQPGGGFRAVYCEGR